MLFFWGNSKAATERHLKEVSENAQRIEQWRGGVDQDPIWLYGMFNLQWAQ
jgi:hypothetical protein